MLIMNIEKRLFDIKTWKFMNFHWKFCYNSELLYRPIKYNFLEILEIKIDWIVKDKITR